MGQQQRLAIFNLAIGLAAVICFVALLPSLGVTKAQAGFAVLALTGLTPFVFRGKGMAPDERDQFIHLRAFRITFVVLWLLFIAGVQGVIFHYTSGVPREIVMLGGWLAWAAFLICQSTALLILYGRS